VVERQRRCRVVFVATLTVLVSLTTAEAPVSEISPLELGGDFGMSLLQMEDAVPTVPLATVTAYTKKLEAENKHLAADNAALRTENSVDQAQQKLAVAGGLMPAPTQPSQSPQESTATAAPPASDLSPEMRKGKKVMDEYSKKNKELEARLAAADAKSNAATENAAATKLQGEEAVLKAQMDGNTKAHLYSRIPFFLFTAGAKEVANLKSQRECQNICDKQIQCQSYSWAAQGLRCMWSVDAVHYDPKYIYSVKAQVATAGDPDATLREFPGVKFITAHSHTKENVDYDGCKQLCESAADCKSFSYRHDTKFCTWGSEGLEYDNSFSYFEKDHHNLSKKLAQKAEQMKKAENALAEQARKRQEQLDGKTDAERKENSEKKAERNRWLSNQPTNSQESHLKMVVNMEMKGMDAKFAMQNAAKKEELAKKARDTFEANQLATVSKLSFMEAELKKLQLKKKEYFDKLKPFEEDKGTAEISIAKLNSKLKINTIERKLKDMAVVNTEQALTAAQRSQNAASIQTCTGQYNDAKQAVTASEDEKGELMSQLQAAHTVLEQKTKALQEAQEEERKYKEEYKSEEIKNKDLVKEEKAAMKKQKLQITADEEKAYTSKMIAYKAKEKKAKSIRANAKVDIWKANEDMKKVTTPETRHEVEKRLADSRGEMFKADQDNEEVLGPLLQAAKDLARTKEILGKAKAAVKKKKEADDRQDVANKLDKLEAESVPSPV